MRYMKLGLGTLACACCTLLFIADRSLAADELSNSLAVIEATGTGETVWEEMPLTQPPDVQLVRHCHPSHHYRYRGYYPVPYSAYYGGYGYSSYYPYRAVVIPGVSYRTYYGGYGGLGYGGYGYGYYRGYGGYGGGCRVVW